MLIRSNILMSNIDHAVNFFYKQEEMPSKLFRI